MQGFFWIVNTILTIFTKIWFWILAGNAKQFVASVLRKQLEAQVTSQDELSPCGSLADCGLGIESVQRQLGKKGYWQSAAHLACRLTPTTHEAIKASRLLKAVAISPLAGKPVLKIQ